MRISNCTRYVSGSLFASMLLASPLTVQAAWHHNGGHFRPPARGYHRGGGGNGGAVLGGALLGLGIGAVVGSALAQPSYAPPPPVYYAPPPAGAYAPPPGAYYPN